MIAIVDYGLGNLSSVRNMLRKAGYEAVVTSEADQIRSAERVILPGVGAFDTGMRNLADRGLVPVLNEVVLENKVPTLGICLGLQLMSQGSEEGALPGLGWLSAETVRFRPADSEGEFRIPHMGWNTVESRSATFLSASAAAEARFYFVHSYHLRCREDSDVALTANYGYEFVAGVVRGNIAGTQFHPEKSHRFGLGLLQAFGNWDGRA